MNTNEIQQETIPALLRTSLGRAGDLLSSQVMISTMRILIEMKKHSELKPYNLTIIILPITSSPYLKTATSLLLTFLETINITYHIID